MEILVTGGAGYIGSHTCVQLLEAGHDVVVLDDLSNSKRETIKRVEELAGKPLRFLQADLKDRAVLERTFADHAFDAVIHFAGSKSVGESVRAPLDYYFNNVYGSLVLFDTMRRFGVKKLVFSSSATVYGLPRSCPIDETFPLSATNPYGRSKLMIEEILRDLAASDPEWSIALLRYFNPIGAHKSGRIGEDPNGIPNNLIPYIAQVAVGKLPQLMVYGGDYETRDGTGVRDYLHVEDLAAGHLKALDRIRSAAGAEAYNLGTGKGYSVFEIIRAFEQASGRPVPFVVTRRRPGDVAECYADPSKAKRELGWEAARGIEEMCEDSWRWQAANPNGYDAEPDAGRRSS
ncbi:UDP-glucose 4-epimerase GalE [Cohnella xylanilytica]|uniref:UDP-glucose 4-epimerase n=1 Tax=Cohnella xylanilytica TaxID=557555 RepID=A0A841U3E8_9BACL|nr:UDP-glucose 4-epimerase GalE [Cohnella xylanilytica]MBB6692843.1 UDP-glucose 4-epimerase GalE [Cohnella xylanilytica]